MNISFKYPRQKIENTRNQIQKHHAKEIPDREIDYIDVEARHIPSHEWEESPSKSEFFYSSSTTKRRSTIPSALIPVLLATAGLAGIGAWGLTHLSGSNSSSPNVTEKKTSSSAASKNKAQKIVPDNFPSGEFAYGSSAAWAPIRRELDPIVQKAWPEFKLRYISSASGASPSGEGIQMLLDNQIAFAQSGRPLHAQEYQKALQQGFSLSEIAVAFEGVAIASHPNLDIPGLTLAQLKDIYTGRITNWSEVGGPDLKITPYSLSAKEAGTAEFFDSQVMGGLAFGENVITIPTTTEALHQVAKHPGSIFYGSAPEIVDQCTVKPLPIGSAPDRLVAPYQAPFVTPQECPARRNQLNIDAMEAGNYPLIQPLFLVVKHDGKADEQAGKAYANWLLSDEGQKLLKKAGFIQIDKF